MNACHIRYKLLHKKQNNETPTPQRLRQYRQHRPDSRRNRFVGAAGRLEITQYKKKQLLKQVYGKKHENRS